MVVEETRDSHTIVNQIRESINQVFVGKEEVVENVLICLFARGHILLEDVPGVGKTTLCQVRERHDRAYLVRKEYSMVYPELFQPKANPVDYRSIGTLHRLGDST